jgi:hypothetical protein
MDVAYIRQRPDISATTRHASTEDWTTKLDVVDEWSVFLRNSRCHEILVVLKPVPVRILSLVVNSIEVDRIVCIRLCSQANLVSLNYWDLPPNVKMKTLNAFRYCDELLNIFHGCPNTGRAPSLFVILAARCLICYQNYVFCPRYWKLSGILFPPNIVEYLGRTEAIIP